MSKRNVWMLLALALAAALVLAGCGGSEGSEGPEGMVGPVGPAGAGWRWTALDGHGLARLALDGAGWHGRSLTGAAGADWRGWC